MYKLQVLHYLNATVSLQLQLLCDERQEAQWTDPLISRAHKPFTCPFTLAHANKLEADTEPGDPCKVGVFSLVWA
jgi:hypothetical protein